MFAWLKRMFGKVEAPGPARWVDCPRCQGWGRVTTFDAGVTRCPQCAGAKRLLLTDADIVKFGGQPGPGRRGDWPVRIAGAAGAVAGMTVALLARNYVTLRPLPWGMIAFLAAMLAGLFLGRLGGRLLSPPGGPPVGPAAPRLTNATARRPW
jgi:hypothetical protein